MNEKDQWVIDNLNAQKAKLEERLENADKKESAAIEKEIVSVEEQIENYGKPKKATKAKK